MVCLSKTQSQRISWPTFMVCYCYEDALYVANLLLLSYMCEDFVFLFRFKMTADCFKIVTTALNCFLILH